MLSNRDKEAIFIGVVLGSAIGYVLPLNIVLMGGLACLLILYLWVC